MVGDSLPRVGARGGALTGYLGSSIEKAGIQILRGTVNAA